MRSRISRLLGKQNRYPGLRSYHVGSFCKYPTVWMPKISKYSPMEHQLRGNWIDGGNYSSEPIPENSIISTKIHVCDSTDLRRHDPFQKGDSLHGHWGIFVSIGKFDEKEAESYIPNLFGVCSDGAWSAGHVEEGCISMKRFKNKDKTDYIWPLATLNEFGNLFGHCDEIEFVIDSTENEEKITKLTIYKNGARLRRNDSRECIADISDFDIPQTGEPLYLYCYVKGGMGTSQLAMLTIVDGSEQSYRDSFLYHDYWNKTKNIP